MGCSGGVVAIGDKVQVITARCIAIVIPQLKGESIIKSNRIVIFTAIDIINSSLLLFCKQRLVFEPIKK